MKKFDLLVLILIVLLIIPLVFYMNFTKERAGERFIELFELEKACYLTELENLQRSDNVYSRELGGFFVELVANSRLNVEKVEQYKWGYLVTYKLFDELDKVYLSFFGRVDYISENGYDFKSDCLNLCNVNVLPQDRVYCYSACDEFESFEKRARLNCDHSFYF
jgi:hypothetical protein